jgi:monofunctional chorismate mutase
MEIKNLREEIDSIDQEMMQLFKKRMAISNLIGQYKKDNHIPIYDAKREAEMLIKYQQAFNDEKLWPYYESFIRHIMALSKEFQK